MTPVRCSSFATASTLRSGENVTRPALDHWQVGNFPSNLQPTAASFNHQARCSVSSCPISVVRQATISIPSDSLSDALAFSHHSDISCGETAEFTQAGYTKKTSASALMRCSLRRCWASKSNQSRKASFVQHIVTNSARCTSRLLGQLMTTTSAMAS